MSIQWNRIMGSHLKIPVKSTLLLIMMLVSCLHLRAQTSDLTFERISLEQGLSESIVGSIIQDRRGFMWFGTEDGLNIYDGYGFTVIRNDPDDPQSLSYNQISDIYEDEEGWLWIGTFNGGLNKHDPQSEAFIRFRNDPNDPNSLSNDIIKNIFQDRYGTIWVGTDNGLNKMVEAASHEGREAVVRFIRYMHDPNDPNSLAHKTVRAIHEDRNGTLWIGTDGGLHNIMLDSLYGESHTSPVKFGRFQHEPDNEKSLSADFVRVIYEDSEGVMWIGTDNGLNKLNLESSEQSGEITYSFRRYRHNPRNPNSLSHNAIYAIYEDDTGDFWVGTNGGGLEKMDRKKGSFTHYQNDPRDPTSLSYNEVWSIYQDRSGLLWVGTYGGGINKIDKGKKQFLHYKNDPNDPNSLNEEIIWHIIEDKAGILWIGTHGGGLNRLDRVTNQFTFYLNNPDDQRSISNNIVRLLMEDEDGMIWIGTHGGGLNRFDGKTETFNRIENNPGDENSLSHNEIRAMYQDRSGTIWIGTRGGGLNKMISGPDGKISTSFKHYRHDSDDSTSIGSDFIRAIHEDHSGRFWIGTLGRGLDKFDRETETFTHYRAQTGNPHSLSNDFIFGIHEDSSGILWLATFGGGLNKFDPDNETFSYYTEEDGLANDVVYGILEDPQGNLWMSTNSGLSRFDPVKETFKNYTVTDGLQSNEFNGGSFYKSQSGEFFFGGINGFNAFYPENIKDNPYIPPIAITEFQKLNQVVKFDKPISDIKELRLTYKDYVFSFQFAALDYTAPEKNQYAHMMEGLDKDWIYTDATKRFVNYTTLAPGKYVFRVKGSNNDGIWNEKGTSIKIIISPPFWRAPWFQAAVVLVVIGLIAALYRRRLKNVRLKTELQAAHDAQMSIMPQSDPQIQGFDISGVCIPANSVGGDFFDYMWLDRKKTRFGIAIGDVSGKAMNAAMTAVMSSGMIFIETDDSPPIHKALSRVNRSLYFKTEKQMFTALCLVALDLNDKSVTFTNAGLHEPLLKSGGKVMEQKSEGPKLPLGAKKDTAYEESRMSMKSGDLLVLITDGIPEAMNYSKSFYGFSRLKTFIETMNTDSMTAEEIKLEIVGDVENFSGNTSQYDDMTVIVIKAGKRGEKR